MYDLYICVINLCVACSYKMNVSMFVLDMLLLTLDIVLAGRKNELKKHTNQTREHELKKLTVQTGILYVCIFSGTGLYIYM